MRTLGLFILTQLKLLLATIKLSLQVRFSSRFVVRKTNDIYLGCFKVLLTGQQQYEVQYNGLTFWNKRREDTFELFLRKIRDNGGMQRFDTKANDLFANITPDTLEYMQREGYGFDFYDINARLLPTNTDLFFMSRSKPSNIIIARLGKEEVDAFMRVHRYTIAEKETIMKQIIDEKLRSPNVFDPKPTELIFGETIPVSKNGLGPNYNAEHLEKYLYAGWIENARVKIEMSGNLAEDFRRAFIKADIDTTDPELAYYVWHHLDDIEFDSDGIATCTMQLINKAFHKQVIVASLKGLIDPTGDVLIAGRHIGSVSLWETLYDLYYK